MPISSQLTGDKAVQEAIAGTLVTQRRLIWDAIHRLGDSLESNVKSDWLSGRALHRRSGRLASSINNRFTSDAVHATSSVGTNVPYGAAWELGFQRNDLGARSGFARRQKSRDVRGRVALPTARITKSGQIITHRRVIISRGVAFVAARNAKQGAEQFQPARPFLKPALEQLKPWIVREIQDAIKEGTSGFGHAGSAGSAG